MHPCYCNIATISWFRFRTHLLFHRFIDIFKIGINEFVAQLLDFRKDIHDVNSRKSLSMKQKKNYSSDSINAAPFQVLFFIFIYFYFFNAFISQIFSRSIRSIIWNSLSGGKQVHHLMIKICFWTHSDWWHSILLEHCGFAGIHSVLTLCFTEMASSLSGLSGFFILSVIRNAIQNTFII